MAPMGDTTLFKHSNKLINSSSPYLQQHAHNPVNWVPWGEEAFEKAKKEDKLVFISVGYSACHWCHVMEHDTFENEEAADYINKHFVSIKVDREERPDVDAVYMNAVQLMTGRGGWPLNCVALPDGRPVFGGTYFPRELFIERLESILLLKETNIQKLEQYAYQLSEGVASSDLLIAPIEGLAKDASGFIWSRNEQNKYGAQIDAKVDHWRKSWDREKGLSKGAPKFTIPTNLDFLLHYGTVRNNKDALAQVKLTLDNMARGGIYDQAGGGFARYSTDADWKIPHFEKMLYDNAQLLTTYSNAYRVFSEPRYKDVALGIINFINQELNDPSGGFRSALDADSDGVEGKYYVWDEDQLSLALSPEDLKIALIAYDINGKSHWEHENSVLMSWQSDEKLAEVVGMSSKEFRDRLKTINKILSNYRDGKNALGEASHVPRVKPGLDDKVLTSWTALTISGLCDAYRAFGNDEHLNRAEKAINFILKSARNADGSLFHVYHEKDGAHINAFLEDYAFTIAACIDMYESTFNPNWLIEARALTLISFDKFYDANTGVFWYTSNEEKELFAKKQENDDSVIPSSNSTMADNLFRMGRYDSEFNWIERSDRMLLSAWENSGNIRRSTNWAQVLLKRTLPFFEVAIFEAIPEKYIQTRQRLDLKYYPQIILAGGIDLPGQPKFLKGKYPSSNGAKFSSIFFICEEGSCKLPVETLHEVNNLLEVGHRD
jgi:uncharacterized protein